MLLDITNTLFS